MNRIFSHRTVLALAVVAAALLGFYRSSLTPEARLATVSQAPAVKHLAAVRPPQGGGNALGSGIRVPSGLQPTLTQAAPEPLVQSAPEQGSAQPPIALREPAGLVLNKLAAETGIDASRYSEAERQQLENLLVRGRYDELAQRAGIDLRKIPPAELNRLQQIVGGTNPAAAEEAPAPAASAEQVAVQDVPDVYQKLREERGVEHLYDLNGTK